MSLLLEVTKLQKKRSFFHRKELFWIKVIMVLFTILSGMFPLNSRIFSASLMTLFFTTLLILLGGGRLLLNLLLLYLGLMAFILPFSLLGGASILYLASINVYTIATFSAILFFVASTPWEQIEEIIGDNILVYAYRMLDISLRDLKRVIDSYNARGLEISALKPWRSVPVIITLLYLTASVRTVTLEESLKARGIS